MWLEVSDTEKEKILRLADAQPVYVQGDKILRLPDAEVVIRWYMVMRGSSASIPKKGGAIAFVLLVYALAFAELQGLRR